MYDINWNPSLRQLRQFAALWFPLAVAILSGLVWYHAGATTLAIVLLVIGLSISVVGLLVPAIMRLIFVGWMCAAWPIGWVVSHLILAVVYYGVVTPIGLTMRLLGRDPLHRRRDAQAHTYWEPHQPPSDTKRYFRQF